MIQHSLNNNKAPDTTTIRGSLFHLIERVKSTNKGMYGFIFKTLLPDGRYFTSRHKYNGKYDDRYFGGGKVIQDYFKSKGLNSQCCDPEEALRIGVTRQILATASTEEELNRLEKQYKDKPAPFFH